MSGRVEAIVSDLREFAGELLDAGIAPSLSPVSSGDAVPGSLASLFDRTRRLTALVPRLLEESELIASSGREELRAIPIPRRALVSRHAADYVAVGERLVPRQWLTAEPVLEADSRSLAWLLHVVDTLADEVRAASERFGRYIQELLPTRQARSRSADEERKKLLLTEGEIARAETALVRSRNQILARSRWRLTASPVLPSPFPRSPVWAVLLDLASSILDPARMLTRELDALLTDCPHIADVPFLYQRWCGVKMLEALETLGFVSADDPVPPLFLGGRISLRRGGVLISLWCEERFTRRGRHASGLHASQEECTPDYVVVTPGPTGLDAFILDPTLATDEDVASLKGHYAYRLEFADMHPVAGVPVMHNPLRSWAAVPTAGRVCSLGDSEGRTGRIPMLPEDYHPQPLLAWMRDVAQHAIAWGSPSVRRTSVAGRE